MLTTLWSVKGGSGVTVVAAALSAIAAKRAGRAVLVDLRGDQPAALGLADPSGPGLHEWLATPSSTPEALERLLVPVDDGLSLLPRGSDGDWPRGRARDLVDALVALRCPVVIDGGTTPDTFRSSPPRPREGDQRTGSADAELLRVELATRGTSLLVTRPCYLALRRAISSSARADGVVLVVDDGRALDRRDVEGVLGLPVVAELHVDPSIARVVDAGLLARRLHHTFERALRGLA